MMNENRRDFKVYKYTNSINGKVYIGKTVQTLKRRAGYNGIGKIYWNEENSMSQNFYSLLNASVYAQKGVFSLELWGKNLTNTNYNAFYFVSVGNTFFSVGKPAQYGVTLSVEF